MKVSEDTIVLLENIIFKIVHYGIGGILCLVGIIIMATHVYLKLDYPDWLITGLTSTIIGFILIIIHSIFNFILKLKSKSEK